MTRFALENNWWAIVMAGGVVCGAIKISFSFNLGSLSFTSPPKISRVT